ncbi:MAG: pyridoxal-dependent decarboxylase [Candidatus Gottesmanbacteria bacterium]
MFGIKKSIHSFLWNTFFPQEPGAFPKSEQKLLAPLKAILIRQKSQTKQSPNYQFGQLLPIPDPVISRLFTNTTKYNINALGNWSNKRDDTSTIHSFEYDIVHSMASLFNVCPEKIGGYVTTGGTEGNVVSAWMGMSHLTRHGCESKACLLRTNLTHYSITKAARIMRIPDKLVGLENSTWGMSPTSLSSTIQRLYEEGKRGFLIPLTLGYTQTGTSDSIENIIRTITVLKRTLTKMHCFVWIDAALSGLTTPFTKDRFSPFQSDMINAIVVDFHKFGGTPIGSGIILYKKRLQKLIQSPIDYLPEADATLLGSRSSAPIVAIWAAIHLFGRIGFTKRVMSQINNKNLFIQLMKRVSSNATVIDEEGSVTCGIVFSDLVDQKIPPNIEQKYGLFAKPITYVFNDKKIKLRIYKFHFLPHCRKEDVCEFMKDIQAIYKSKRS